MSRDVRDTSYDGVGDMVGGMVEREYPIGAERCESRGCEMVLNENLRGVFSQLIAGARAAHSPNGERPLNAPGKRHRDAGRQRPS
jgi:hypothetical protein